MGAVINDETIPQFKCEIIAGSANNVLHREKIHARMLMEKNITYAPDYVINAGGLINVANELEGWRYGANRCILKSDGRGQHCRTEEIHQSVLGVEGRVVGNSPLANIRAIAGLSCP